MEGRSEPQSLTPDPLDPVDPVDPVDPLDPVVNSEWRVLGMKNNENENVIPEYATLQAFLLLLCSKCQHSNDFITFSQTKL